MTYRIPEINNPNPNKYVMLVVLAYDYRTKAPINDAQVEIRNSSWNLIDQTNQFGWCVATDKATGMVEWLLLGDEYIVTVRCQSSTATARIVLEQSSNRTIYGSDYTIHGMKKDSDLFYRLEFHFKFINAVTFEPYPSWYLYPIYAFALACPLLVVWYLYQKQEEERKRLTEEKKKIGRIKRKRTGLKQYLWEFFDREAKRPHMVKVFGFIALGALGMAFAPFYPWWMVLVLALVVGIISYRFPYLALIILSILVTASAGYQSPEFGMIFLVFSLFILLCGFFDWKFCFLVFLAVFAGRFGLPFLIPIFTTIVFSTFLGVAVAATSLAFLTFLVTCGDISIMGIFVGVRHEGAIAMFSSPVQSQFTPSAIGSAFSGIGHADMDFINTIISNNFGSSMTPFILIIVWCFAIYLIGHIVQNKGIKRHSLKAWLKYPLRAKKAGWLVSGSLSLFIASSAVALFLMGFFDPMTALQKAGVAMLFVCAGAVVYTGIIAALITREIFSEYYSSLIGVSSVGTRISDMTGLGKTTFEMVGGLHDVKQDLKESMIVPLLRPDIADQFGIEPAKGILLFGPPGCGKTLLMKALATELHVEMINIKCSDIMSKWYGESEGRMTELFKTAKERRPCIIFLDEVDAIAKRRDMYSADDVTPRLLSIMLSELDGMDRSAGIIIVGSTNKPDICDPALLRPGRFDKIIYVPPPDYEERLDIFRVHLQGKPVSKDLNLHEYAKKTERFSGADIANLVKEAATIGMRRSMQTGKFTRITEEDFMSVVHKVRPSISLSMKEEYEKIKIRYERKMHDLYRTEKKAAIKWDDVADLEDVKKQLREYIELPLKRPDLVEQFKLRTGKGLFLYGPPGCGKTYLMKAAANEFNVPMQMINSSELINSLVSEGERAMREIFVRARDTAPSIICFVEIELLLSKPDAEAADSVRGVFVQSQLISSIDNLHPSDKVVVVATTDRPDLISPEFFAPGRFERRLYVRPPDKEMRRKTFEIYLKDVPKHGDIDHDILAEKTVGYSSEDIANVVNEAKLVSIREGFYSGDEEQTDKYGVGMDELVKVIEKTRGSLTQEMLSRCEEFGGNDGK